MFSLSLSLSLSLSPFLPPSPHTNKIFLNRIVGGSGVWSWEGVSLYISLMEINGGKNTIKINYIF